MALPSLPRASQRSAQLYFERLFGELDLLHLIIAVGQLSCSTDPFHFGSFVFLPVLNLFVHRSGLTRRASTEYYPFRAQETGPNVDLVLPFSRELHIPYRRLVRTEFLPWLDEALFDANIVFLRVRRPTNPFWC